MCTAKLGVTASRQFFEKVCWWSASVIWLLMWCLFAWFVYTWHVDWKLKRWNELNVNDYRSSYSLGTIGLGLPSHMLWTAILRTTLLFL